MSVIASCGHKLTEQENLGILIAIKDYSKDGKKAISYPSVCNKCFEFYKKQNLILHTKKDKDEWIGIKTSRSNELKKIKKLLYKFRDEKMPNWNKPFHYDAEGWGAMKMFVEWVESKNNKNY